MGRWSGYGQKESQWVLDGDPGFRGIDMLHDRSLIAPGYLARCENKRLRDGVAATRMGTTFPGDFNPGFENKIIGSGIYSNPNGDEVMLVATAGATYVWALQYGKDPIQIDIDSGDATGETGDFFVHFVQAFDKVFLLRYPFAGLSPLVWDGNPTSKFTNFTPGGAGTAIPSTITGVPFQNRILLYNPYYPVVPWRDQFIMTDILDYTQYDNVLSVFRVDAGESDEITSIMPYFKGGAVVFKQNSIHMVTDFTVDQTLTTQRLLNSRIGGIGIYGPVLDGADVIFLSKPGGFYRLSQIDQENVATQPVPISRRIQPVIDRINWDRANLWTCSAAIGDYVYFALPTGRDISIKGSDIIVVLNAATNEWESAPDSWEDPTFRINRLHVTLYDGAPRLFALDYVAQKIYLMYDGLEDEINGDSRPVRDVIETRGYTFGSPGSFKRCQRATIGIRSYDPDGIVTAISDGVNEEKQIAMIDKDRLHFYVHGRANFNALTDDPLEAKREDYSDDSENAAIEDFEDLADGDILFIPGTSFTFSGEKQQSLERFQVRQNGRWCSIRVENNRGQLDVLGVAVEAIPASEGIKVVA